MWKEWRAQQKARSALNASRADRKASRAGPLFAYTQVGQPQWTPRRYDKLADEGYQRNVIVYRCISEVARAAAGVPLLLYDDLGEEINAHPALQLLTQPNPLQDGVLLREMLFAQFQIAGNAYLEIVDDEMQPQELYALRPDRMRVVPGAHGLPLAYEYHQGARVQRWECDALSGESAIMHWKSFHPLDDWYGMGALEAAQISIDQHNIAGAWNQALLAQGARPSGALLYAPKEGPATLSDTQFQRLKEELETQYQSSRNAGRPLLLEGGLEWKEMSLSPKDMDWLEGRDRAARDIALAFGVPGQLIGLADAQTYANLAEARLAFYEETIVPLVQKFCSALNHWLLPKFGHGLRLEPDLDAISALTRRRELMWEKINKADFLTLNEKRQALGYGPLSGGDALHSFSNPHAELTSERMERA